MNAGLRLWRHGRLATMTSGIPWGWVDDGALMCCGDTLAAIPRTTRVTVEG